MSYQVIAVFLAAFVGGWWYAARTLKSMGPLFSNLLALPVGLVAMLCVAGIAFYFGWVKL